MIDELVFRDEYEDEMIVQTDQGELNLSNVDLEPGDNMPLPIANEEAEFFPLSINDELEVLAAETLA